MKLRSSETDCRNRRCHFVLQNRKALARKARKNSNARGSRGNRLLNRCLTVFSEKSSNDIWNVRRWNHQKEGKHLHLFSSRALPQATRFHVAGRCDELMTFAQSAQLSLSVSKLSSPAAQAPSLILNAASVKHSPL